MLESQVFIAAVYKSDFNEIYRVLRRADIHPHTCKDTKGQTALHIATLNANLTIINFLSDFVISKQIFTKYKLDSTRILQE